MKMKQNEQMKAQGTVHAHAHPYNAGCPVFGCEPTILYEVLADQNYPYTWRAEAIGDDGEIYVAMFSGPNAEELCKAYAAWKNAERPK